MTIIQIIYTMADGQHLANFPVFPHVLESKRNFKTFAKEAFYSHISFFDKSKWGVQPSGENLGLPESMAVKPIFVKLYCCIISPKGKHPKIPEWYSKCNGKLYWSDLNPGKKNPYI